MTAMLLMLAAVAGVIYLRIRTDRARNRQARLR